MSNVVRGSKSENVTIVGRANEVAKAEQLMAPDETVMITSISPLLEQYLNQHESKWLADVQTKTKTYLRFSRSYVSAVEPLITH